MCVVVALVVVVLVAALFIVSVVVANVAGDIVVGVVCSIGDSLLREIKQLSQL